jgi:hypothetical protein
VSDIKDLIDRLSDRQRREFVLWCTKRHTIADPGKTKLLDVISRHLRDDGTDPELDAAWESVTDAAEYAAWAAAAAEWAAAAAACETERAVQRAELERMLGRAAGAEEVKP